MSYYERWLQSLVELMVKGGLITRTEVESGKPAPGSPKATAALIASAVADMVATGNPESREVRVAARFAVGQRVRARNLHPTGHTRLPRYARGKLGTIQLDHGVYTNADSLDEKPQHLYSVRFAARELWGEQASERDAVYLDMWDDYLECTLVHLRTRAPPSAAAAAARRGRAGVCRALAGPGVRAGGEALPVKSTELASWLTDCRHPPQYN
jgi:nitrile hydratase subunit beta